ncbi:Dynein intermediate chain 3, ciliary [Folsomia candida]|uniref:Dynein intermediate chain 3, ciliary n=2 Tax=Folsomia candida TaxID=158441 RepID=A0A226EIF4_FOLCA|nr:Dynein intermediate chain 3, ciliary [Folsomia candida]
MRKEFGRQERCLQDHFRIHANVKPLQKYRKLVVKKTVVDRDVQAAPGVCVNEMNTIRAEYAEFSGLHEEGGWPKDINMNDPEMIQRHRKKLEKEDAFTIAVPLMADEMEELIKNNNTINFYRSAFSCDSIIAPDRELVPTATVVNVYKNPANRPRRVSRITFAPENIGRMAVAQCPYEFDPSLRQHAGEAFFWEIENPTRPEGMIRAGSPITDVRYHPKDLHTIVGSLFTGQVATWDARVSPNPQLVSTYETSHTDVCTTALWINSKTGCEFFSSGLDGQVIWWDERNLSQTLDTLWCDPEKGQGRPEFAHGATVLEYEHTLPTKFLAGTDRGNVMVFMKKGKSPSERMIHMYKAHKGPVMACHRNPMFIKNFLTVGEYHIRIFAEDCKESSIMWTVPAETRYADANWLINRPSCFIACRNDGVLEWWDLLIRGGNNIMQMKVCDEALTAVCAADTGKHIAVGSIHGDVRFIQMSDLMSDFDKGEKPMLAAVFDRESRREKYLEQRNREIRLKKRDLEKQEAIQKKLEEDEAAERKALGLPDIEGMDPIQVKGMKIRQEVARNPIIQAEREFFISIDEEIRTKGIDAFPDKKVAKKKKSEDGDEHQEGGAVNITAADLAALDFHEDEQGADEGKPEAPPAAPEATPSQTAAAPLPPQSTTPSESQLAPPEPPEEEEEEEGEESPADEEAQNEVDEADDEEEE